MRLVIADDHALFRDSLRSLLTARGLEVVGEAKNGREAVDLAKLLRPDVILMDLAMPEMNGLDATRAICAELEDVKVVVLTASNDDADLFEAIKAGGRRLPAQRPRSRSFFSSARRRCPGRAGADARIGAQAAHGIRQAARRGEERS